MSTFTKLHNKKSNSFNIKQYKREIKLKFNSLTKFLNSYEIELRPKIQRFKTEGVFFTLF